MAERLPGDAEQILALLVDGMASFDDHEVEVVDPTGDHRVRYKDVWDDLTSLGQANVFARAETARALRAQGLIRLDYRGTQKMSPKYFCPLVASINGKLVPSAEPRSWDEVTVAVDLTPPSRLSPWKMVHHLVVLTPFQFESWVWRLRSWALSRMRVVMCRPRGDGNDGEGGNLEEFGDGDEDRATPPAEASSPVAVAGPGTPRFDIDWKRRAAAPIVVRPGHAGRRLDTDAMSSLLRRILLRTEDLLRTTADPLDSRRMADWLGDAMSSGRLEELNLAVGGRLSVDAGPQRERFIHFLVGSIRSMSTDQALTRITCGQGHLGVVAWIEEAESLLAARVDRIDNVYTLDLDGDMDRLSRIETHSALLSSEYGMAMGDALALLKTLTRTRNGHVLRRSLVQVIDTAIAGLRTLVCRALVNCWAISVYRGSAYWDENITQLSHTCPVRLCPCGIMRRIGVHVDPDGAADGWLDVPAGLAAQCRYSVVLSHHIRKHAVDPKEDSPPMTAARLQAIECLLRRLSREETVLGDMLTGVIQEDLSTLSRAAGRQKPYVKTNNPFRTLEIWSYDPGEWYELWHDLPLMRGRYLLRRGDGSAVRSRKPHTDGPVTIDENGDEVDQAGDHAEAHALVGFNLTSLAGRNTVGV